MFLKLGYSKVYLRLVEKIKGAVGLWVPKKGSADATIKILRELKGMVFIHTIVHELVHHIEHYEQLDLTEEQVELISRGMTELLFGSELLDASDFEERVRTLLEPK